MDMKKMDDEEFEKDLRFVLKYYDPDAFDAKKSFEVISKKLNLKPARKPVFKRVLLWSAGVAAIAVAGIFINLRSKVTEYMAGAEPQEFVLPDSSVVTLSPGSRLEFWSGKPARRVWMSGKAYFDVRHEESRPFEIVSSNAFVRVLGTRFQVDQTDSAVTVNVLSGKVLFAGKPSDDVRKSASTAGFSDEFSLAEHFGGMILHCGDNAVLKADSSHPETVAAASLNPAVWATHKFVYDSAPLSEVLEELSSYFKCSLTLSGDEADCTSGDPAESRRLTGEFDAKSPDEIISLIEAALDVKILMVD